MPARLTILMILASVAIGSGAAGAQVLTDEAPEIIRDLEISDQRGSMVPPDIEVFDSTGKTLEIGEYFSDNRPIALLLVYYDCPMLCGQMLEKMNSVINATDPTVGKDYKIVVVSFDHTNTTEMARQKQELYHLGYDRGLDELGQTSYEFHTATAAESRRLADAVGFDYRFSPVTGEFGHPSVIYFLTPSGEVSSYLSGLDYEPKQFRLAIIDAKNSKIASSVGEFFLHMCFTFDPQAGAYTIQAFRVMQVAAVLSVIGVGGLVVGLRIFESVRKRAMKTKPGASAVDGSQSTARDHPVSRPMQGAMHS